MRENDYRLYEKYKNIYPKSHISLVRELTMDDYLEILEKFEDSNLERAINKLRDFSVYYNNYSGFHKMKIYVKLEYFYSHNDDIYHTCKTGKGINLLIEYNYQALVSNIESKLLLNSQYGSHGRIPEREKFSYFKIENFNDEYNIDNTIHSLNSIFDNIEFVYKLHKRERVLKNIKNEI